MIGSTFQKQVTLLVETSNRYGREIVLGVFDFSRQCGEWNVHVAEHGRNQFGSDWQHAAKSDGIIARVETIGNAEKIRQLNCPVVNISSLRLVPEFVNIIVDSDAVSVLAAEHLHGLGFVNYGFFGISQYPWSEQRRISFASSIKKAGFHYQEYSLKFRNIQNYDRDRDRLVNWLSALPKPVGIMSATDSLGQYLLQVCHEVGLHVPDEVAVIGVNNDELYCELSDPPLSSVILNGRRAGYEAAAVLHKLMQDTNVPAGYRTIPPSGIAARRSTDFIAVEDEQVAAALSYIRDHACQGITVGDVVAASHLSRSALERRFRKHLNCSLHSRIQSVKISQVQLLLIQTTMPIKEIAIRSGFENAEYLTVAFKRHTGVSPSEYRQQAEVS